MCGRSLDRFGSGKALGPGEQTDTEELRERSDYWSAGIDEQAKKAQSVIVTSSHDAIVCPRVSATGEELLVLRVGRVVNGRGIEGRIHRSQ